MRAQIEKVCRISVWSHIVHTIMIVICAMMFASMLSGCTPVPVSPVPAPTYTVTKRTVTPTPTVAVTEAYAKPSTTTVGIPAGVTLTNHVGDLTITTPGTHVYRKNVLGRIIVKAADVTIEETRVKGGSGYSEPTPFIDARDSSVKRLVLTRVDVVPTTPSEWTVGFDGHNATIRDSYFRHLQDSIRVRNGADDRSNVIIEHNLMNGLTYYLTSEERFSDKQTHNDSIQIIGAVGVVIRWNNIRAYHSALGQYNPPVDASPTPSGHDRLALSAIMLNADSVKGTKVSGLVLTDNWIAGAQQVINAGDPGLADANLGDIYDNKFDGNDASGIPLRFRDDQTVDAQRNTYEDTEAPVVPQYTA